MEVSSGLPAFHVRTIVFGGLISAFRPDGGLTAISLRIVVPGATPPSAGEAQRPAPQRTISNPIIHRRFISLLLIPVQAARAIHPSPTSAPLSSTRSNGATHPRPCRHP